MEETGGHQETDLQYGINVYYDVEYLKHNLQIKINNILIKAQRKIRLNQTLVPWFFDTSLLSESSHLFPTNMVSIFWVVYQKKTTKTEVKHRDSGLHHPVSHSKPLIVQQAAQVQSARTQILDSCEGQRTECLLPYFIHITDPLGYVLKGQLVCDVVDKDDTLHKKWKED